jgi:murein DD-endopeptidase MepM/ murein hydrolase activator NlpD
MQSRKSNARQGPAKGRTHGPRRDPRRGGRRSGSPRQRLAVGLVVGTGLYTTLFGAGAGAQAPAMAITAAASPPPPASTDTEGGGIASTEADPQDGGSGAPPQGSGGAPTDPGGPSDPGPQSDADGQSDPGAPAGAEPAAPAAAEAGTPAADPAAPAGADAAAPAGGGPAGDASSDSDGSAATVTRPNVADRAGDKNAAGTSTRTRRHARDAKGKSPRDKPARRVTHEPAAPPATALGPESPVAPVGGSSVASPASSPHTASLPLGLSGLSMENFRIPLLLLPIYQAAGIHYGVSWEVLAAINEIETDYGRNLNVSSAGAVGWMQFMPSTWDRYGVDANGDGVRDPYNPVDAIFAAARYLHAAGAQNDLRGAILAYNHADWYADSVLSRAGTISSLPGPVVDSLTGLAQGRLPVRGPATSSGPGDGIRISARPGAAVVAVNDGTIVRTGHAQRLGRFVQLRDAYGNTYTYARLATVGRDRRSPGRAAVSPTGSRRDPERLRKGVRVNSGTIVGRVGSTRGSRARRMLFEIRPAGRSAPRIDPKPILDGWNVLRSTAMYRVPSSRRSSARHSESRILLMSKGALATHVLSDPGIAIYPCGRQNIRAGQIDRRVLATLAFLSASGLKPTVSSLKCGHSFLTSSGNVSEHSTGTAVDIAAINGIPIAGHQGEGSITETVVRRLLTLQGAMKPHQIITLMQFQGADNTFAMADHADHIHVGWRPLYGSSTAAGGPVDETFEPKQWTKLVDRLGKIESPKDVVKPRSRSGHRHRPEGR